MKKFDFEDTSRDFGETINISDLKKQIDEMEKEISDNPSKGKKPYPLITLACIAVFAAVFIICFNAIGRNSSNTEKSPSGYAAGYTTGELSFFGIIKEAPESGVFRATDFKSGTETVLKITSDSKFFDVTGKEISSDTVAYGDILKVEAKDGELYSAAYSDEITVLKSITEAYSDSAKNALVYNGKEYNITENTCVSYKKADIPSDDILSIDVITVKLLDDDVAFIDVEKSHGYISITNFGNIENGTVCIDKGKKQTLTKDFYVVKEGIREIVIEGSNIEAYSANIYCEAFKRQTIDLLETQSKYLIVSFKVDTLDFDLYIDDVKAEYISGFHMLEPGTHKFKAEKEGFKTWETELEIKNTYTEIPITLTPETSNVTIYTNPSTAKVYIDGEFKGSSPLMLSLTNGIHEIVIEKDGYKVYESIIDMSYTTKEITIDLKKAD